jgi:hypothetical protein
MIRLSLSEPRTPEWKKWRKDAHDGHVTLRTEFRQTGTFTVRDSLYKRMKQTFFKLYHNKCAYCETSLRVDGWDQLDHYRPKNAVLRSNGKVVCVGSRKKPHPGYYWLAYEWTNLIPSCAICNGKKGAIFPLRPNSVHATRPGSEAGERPIFIHPVSENPQDHFEYVPSTGFLKSKTARGKHCIDLLDLNRPALVEQRQEAYQACINRVSDVLNAVKKSEPRAARDVEKLMSIVKGIAEYSLVGRHALNECKLALDGILRKN